jgi:hypothetical protein
MRVWLFGDRRCRSGFWIRLGVVGLDGGVRCSVMDG